MSASGEFRNHDRQRSAQDERREPPRDERPGSGVHKTEVHARRVTWFATDFKLDGQARQGCCSIRVIRRGTATAALKSEARNPIPEGRPKSEIRERLDAICYSSAMGGCGFGIRLSDLEGAGLTFAVPAGAK